VATMVPVGATKCARGSDELAWSGREFGLEFVFVFAFAFEPADSHWEHIIISGGTREARKARKARGKRQELARRPEQSFTFGALLVLFVRADRQIKLLAR